MNSEIFWGVIRENLFGGNMTQGVVDTINIITDTYYAEAGGNAVPEHLAYVLATAYHESYHRSLNPNWNPVREGFSNTNAGAIATVTMLYNQGRISTNYAKVQPNGKSYYGRGYVQITWPNNYIRMGDRLGIDLYGNPDLSLERGTAARLLVIGMIEGLYTGRKLSDYGSHDFDAYNARRIINGLDKAELIKGYYETFNLAIAGSIHAG